MLDVIRNSAKGNTGKIIVGLIVITFVLFGAESIVSITGNSAPAKVNGQDVSELDYQRLLSSRQQELVQQFGAELAAEFANSSFIRDEVINTLVNQTLQLQLSNELGFDVSEQQVLGSFASIPAFQIDGQFDQDRYLSVIANNGYNHQSFVSDQREQSALTQLQAGIANSAFSVKKITNGYAELDAQTRSFAVKDYRVEDYLPLASVSEEMVRSYYEENSSEFMSEEQVKLDYIAIEFESVAGDVLVTDNEIQSAYDSYVAQANSNVTREIAHILFADGETQLADAQAALDRLAAGESFADLAMELSDDPGSAEFGGSLGALIPDVYVDEFYDAALRLTNAGDVSEPVATEYGVHLILLETISTEAIESLESLAGELGDDIRERKARDELLLIEQQLADEAFASDQLVELEAVFNTSVQTSDWLTRSSSIAPFTSSDFVATVFDDEVLFENRISSVMRLENGDLVVAQLNEYQGEDVLPLETVEEEITSILTNEEANRLMLAEIEAALEEGVSVDETWQAYELVTRSEQIPSRDLVNFVFSLAKPAEGKVTVEQFESEDGASIVALSQVNSPEVINEELDDAQQEFSGFAASSQYQLFFNVERNSAEVSVRQ